MFLGNNDFIWVMLRARLKDIRGNVRLYPYYVHDGATESHLWHSEMLLDHIAKNCASVSVPTCVTTLDDNTVRCKGRTTAHSYMESKLFKFVICI